MSQVSAEMIDGLAFFDGFAYADLELLARYLSARAAAQGEVIFHEGEEGRYMLILLCGRIAIHKGGEQGRHLLCYEGVGRIVGEMALLDQERRSANCVADSDCAMLQLDHDDLARLAREHPGLAFRFMQALARLLSRRLRRTSGVLAEHMLD